MIAYDNNADSSGEETEKERLPENISVLGWVSCCFGEHLNWNTISR